METNNASPKGNVVCLLLVFLGFACTSKSALAEESEILKVTVGEPTVMAPKPGHTIGVLAVSRTGIAAAHYQSGSTYVHRISTDAGQTWTKPRLTQPPLKTISPTLAVLDNGVVACVYGRPGVHVVFSTDNGHTWTNRVTFTNLGTLWLLKGKDRSEGRSICGQADMVKVGPNKLLAIGPVGYPGGTRVFPITVERIKVSPARVALTGRVLDQQGQPIAGATVERSPNRYAVDSWKEDTELDPWKGGPKIVGLPSPWLDYRSIRRENGYSTVKTDRQGHFRFESVTLGEHILTVEAAGYAPQSQRVKLALEPESQRAEFSLKPGKAVRGRVLDSRGKAVVGASVILNKWHVYSDSKGFFSWSVQAPVPDEVELNVHRLYSRKYKPLEKTILLSQIEKRPVILQRVN